MPTLVQTLPSNDIGYLRIVASLWGLELTSSDAAEAAIELAESLCDAELLEEVVATLPGDGTSALNALAAENGRMPWVAFARRFGDIREMGAGKRDREQPHLTPSSAAEVLWYRALLAKAFFNPDKVQLEKFPDRGPQEYAFIPDDLFTAMDFAGIFSEHVLEEPPEDYLEGSGQSDSAQIDETALSQQRSALNDELPGRPASPNEKANPILATDSILDDACTFLSALRMGFEPPEMQTPAGFLRELLQVSGLIKGKVLNPELIKNFLEAPRSKALGLLRDAWQFSDQFNDLRQMPGLDFEGGWSNQPLVTREFLLNLLESVPDGQWWSLPAFVRDIKTRYPDFQRPAGDYDSWFIKRQSDGIFLRGFSSWDEIDGALIRHLICGPLRWLGLLDLACPQEGTPPTAFRSRDLPIQDVPAAESPKLSVNSQGKIIVPRLAARAVRYQIARFCEWDSPREAEYVYRVTAFSLLRAREQGLKAEHLLGILRKNSSAPLPPPFVKALQRWEQNGSEARVENLVVLKVARPELMNELRASKAGRFLGEIIGPTTVVIQAGAQARVMAAMAELGILVEGEK